MPNNNPVIKILQEQQFNRGLNPGDWYEDNTDSIDELVRKIKGINTLEFASESLSYVLEKKLYAFTSEEEHNKVLIREKSRKPRVLLQFAEKKVPLEEIFDNKSFGDVYSSVKDRQKNKYNSFASVVEELIRPFEGKHNSELSRALLHTNETLLHSFYRHYDDLQSDVIQSLIKRARQLNFDQQKDILLAQNLQGENFYHIATQKQRNIDNTNILFPEPILLAFCQPDKSLKTPLHYAYKNNIANVKFIVNIWKNNNHTFRKIFQPKMHEGLKLQDEKGKNVLHYAFVSDEKKATVLLKNTVTLLLKDDSSESIALARQTLFDCLTARDHAGISPLEIILQKKNTVLLQETLKALGSFQSFELFRQQKSNINKQINQNIKKAKQYYEQPTVFCSETQVKDLFLKRMGWFELYDFINRHERGYFSKRSDTEAMKKDFINLLNRKLADAPKVNAYIELTKKLPWEDDLRIEFINYIQSKKQPTSFDTQIISALHLNQSRKAQLAV